jgi:hypothetical protein
VKELALVIVAVEWVSLNGQVIFPRSMLALPHAWRDWLLADGVTFASAALWAQPIAPRGHNLRISASASRNIPLPRFPASRNSPTTWSKFTLQWRNLT